VSAHGRGAARRPDAAHGAKGLPTETVTLSSRFRITIPKAIREDRRWEVGQAFVLIPKGMGLLLMPVPEFEQLAGIAKGARKLSIRDRRDRY
jgi:AbrB family looped-hinge helix DNA binding protein